MVLICEHCNRPTLKVENGEIQLLNKHGSATHENILSLDDLKLIAAVIFAQNNPATILIIE